MTVVKGYFCGKMYATVPELRELPAEAGEEIVLNVALNSKVGVGRPCGWAATSMAGRQAGRQAGTECAQLLPC